MFPFDRLVQSVDEMLGGKLIEGTIVAQIGDGRYEPRHMAFDRYLAKPDYDRRIVDAQMLIGHAGAGTIALALKHRKPLLVVPRLGKFKEHVNDHQVDTAHKYEELGYVLVAYEMQDIPAKLAALKNFQPRSREARPQDLARRIGAFLETLLPPRGAITRPRAQASALEHDT
jgi:UDP-N-acetylglucosamine transferase subunit ALG13